MDELVINIRITVAVEDMGAHFDRKLEEELHYLLKDGWIVDEVMSGAYDAWMSERLYDLAPDEEAYKDWELLAHSVDVVEE